MLWRAHIQRTFLLNVSLKKEVNLQSTPSCETYEATTNKRNFHFQSYESKRVSSFDLLNSNLFEKRLASTDSHGGINFLPKSIVKFTTENITNRLTELPTIEVLEKFPQLEHCIPVESIQNGLIYLHAYYGLPWWSVIVMSAISLRLLLLPLTIFSERNNAHISNHLPQVEYLKMQLTDAKQGGDSAKETRLAQELMLLKEYKELSYPKSLLVTLAQVPLFILFLTSLRGMTNARLQSMREGGLFWFNDLTAADTTFILPIITSATLCIIIELFLKNAKIAMDNRAAFNLMRACPFIILPFTVDFPAAFLFYWTCNNFITLAQYSIFQIPAVRDLLNFEKAFIHYIPHNFTSQEALIPQPKMEHQLYRKRSLDEEAKQRLGNMRLSKIRKDPLGKYSSALHLAHVPPLTQRLKLRAIMEQSKSQF